MNAPHEELDSAIERLTARYYDTHDATTGELLPPEQWAHGSTWDIDAAPAWTRPVTQQIVIEFDTAAAFGQYMTDELRKWIRRRSGPGVT